MLGCDQPVFDPVRARTPALRSLLPTYRPALTAKPVPRPFDFEIEPGVWFGSWFLSELRREAKFEEDPAWLERVAVPSRRLQKGRPPDWRFEVHVPWLKSQTAFVAPGRHIYFGRRLLERLRHEDSVAFVIAHEIAHQDLGHLTFLKDWQTGIRASSIRTVGAVLFHHLLRRAYSPEQELEADRWSIDACIEAGYDPARCLETFRTLRHMALEWGDIDGVFGPGEGLEGRLDWLNRTKLWLWQRGRGYLPVNDREGALRRHLRHRR